MNDTCIRRLLCLTAMSSRVYAIGGYMDAVSVGSMYTYWRPRLLDA